MFCQISMCCSVVVDCSNAFLFRFLTCNCYISRCILGTGTSPEEMQLIQETCRDSHLFISKSTKTHCKQLSPHPQDANLEGESVDGNVKVLGEHEPVTTIQRKNCPIVQLRKKLQKWISIDVEGQDCDSDSISGEISDVDKKLDEDELYSSDSDEQIINVQIRHSTAFWEKQLHNMNT